MAIPTSTKPPQTFIMPSKYKTVNDLPVPKDSRVRLVEVPEHKVCCTIYEMH